MAGLFLLLAVLKAEPLAKKIETVKKKSSKLKIETVRPGPNEAVALAVSGLPEDEADRLFTRYIWVRGGDSEAAKATAFALNAVSRAAALYRPAPFNADGIILMRIDLRRLAPTAAETAEYLKLWEEFRFDPRFSLLITKDSLKSLKFLEGEDEPTVKVKRSKEVIVTVPAFVHTDGKTYTQRRVVQDFFEEVRLSKLAVSTTDVLRIAGPHLDSGPFGYLQLVTGSEAPIVSHDYLMTRLLSTVKGKGLFKQIYGGLYYEFAGIKRGAKKGTDEDALFEQLGVGGQGVTASTVYEKVKSDQRVAVFRSGVTGKPRRIDILRSLAGRDGTGLVAVTHDVKNDDIDVSQHPIMNLLNSKDAAREVIFERSNGLHGFALFNGVGALQDEVPIAVAVDRTVPSPYSPILQPAIGCIRCHGADGSVGWKELKNDVKQLLSGYVDVFGDTSEAKKLIPETLDRLAGLYAGSPDKALMRGRDDYDAAILKVTGPWKGAADKAQVDVVKLASGKVGETYAEYNFETVDSKKALKELGWSTADSNEATTLLRKLLPPDKASQIDGIFPEDPRCAALLMGLEIPRADFDLVFSFMATRIQRFQEKLK